LINVSICNQSTLFKDVDLQPLANALQIQVNRDFTPLWGIQAQIFFTPSTDAPSPDHWVLAILDDADQAGALGYHDVTPAGQPLGKAFVRTTQAAGDTFSVTVSHELVEMLADPEINLCAEFDDADGSPSKFYAVEACDACEDDPYGYLVTIPAGWVGVGQQILVSDFVTRAWFEPKASSGTQFDFQKKITAPFQILANGYIGFLDLANLAAGWQQDVTALRDAKALMKARPHLGSRRLKRMLGKKNWVTSTYKAGVHSAIAAAPIGGSQ
jgi:hypothetical protein